MIGKYSVDREADLIKHTHVMWEGAAIQGKISILPKHRENTYWDENQYDLIHDLMQKPLQIGPWDGIQCLYMSGACTGKLRLWSVHSKSSSRAAWFTAVFPTVTVCCLMFLLIFSINNRLFRNDPLITKKIVSLKSTIYLAFDLITIILIAWYCMQCFSGLNFYLKCRFAIAWNLNNWFVF